jgi:hypothetical protein
MTYYFRTHFNYAGPIDANTHLYLSLYVDDGAIIYLNGQEVKRVHFNNYPTSTSVYYATLADDHEFALETRIEIPAGALLSGDNVLAVEVHQAKTDSSDIVWGSKLEVKQSGTTEVVLREVQTPSNIAALANGLRITEMMYQPAGNPAAEYIKLQNVGSTALQLGGVRFNRAVEFIFPSMTLQPGESTVVVRDTTAFRAAYGSAIPIAGQYLGSLNNSGEEVVLQLPDPYGDGILRYTYSPNWYPAASGGGKALQIRDPLAPAASWDQSESWQAAAPGWNTLVVTPSDWTAAGLTLELAGDNKLHVHIAGTTTDAVPPMLAADVTRISIVGRGAGDVLTVLTTGNGVANLLLANATLDVGLDNAISAGANVTVDGGALNFNGHSDPIGNLTVINNGQAAVTAIENDTTTVESGTLTVASIVCDTLIIGSASGGSAAASANATPSVAIDPPRPAADFVESDSLAVEALPVVFAVEPAAVQEISMLELASAFQPTPRIETLSEPIFTILPLEETLSGETLSDPKSMPIFDRQPSAARAPIDERIVNPAFEEPEAFVSNANQNAHRLALRSLVGEITQDAAYESNNLQLILGRYSRKKDKLTKRAVDESIAELSTESWKRF